MKNEFLYIKRKPVAFTSLIILAVLYFFMIFAEFISPYTPTKTFETNTFHPANVKITLRGIKAIVKKSQHSFTIPSLPQGAFLAPPSAYKKRRQANACHLIDHPPIGAIKPQFEFNTAASNVFLLIPQGSTILLPPVTFTRSA